MLVVEQMKVAERRQTGRLDGSVSKGAGVLALDFRGPGLGGAFGLE